MRPKTLIVELTPLVPTINPTFLAKTFQDQATKVTDAFSAENSSCKLVVWEKSGKCYLAVHRISMRCIMKQVMMMVKDLERRQMWVCTGVTYIHGKYMAVSPLDGVTTLTQETMDCLLTGACVENTINSEEFLRLSGVLDE